MGCGKINVDVNVDASDNDSLMPREIVVALSDSPRNLAGEFVLV